MASLTTDKAGNRNIRFADPNGARKCVYLGKLALKACQRIQGHIERLASSAISGEPVADETARWLSKLDDVLRGKLVRVGLVKVRETMTLMGCIDRYATSRTDAKPRTQSNWHQARRHLLKFFGEGRLIREISKADARDFRRSMLSSGLSENTTRKTCSVCRQILADAVDRGALTENPFRQKGVPTSTIANTDRVAYVSREDVAAILDACPSAEWRAIIALSRFGGLRCPSETLELRWADINWSRGRMTVRSPKTERHEGGASRIVPLFPDLRPHLEVAFESAKTGSEFVVARYRGAGCNIRTEFSRIIARAGVQSWPKPFHNLRSSCETDLLKIHPIRPVCTWLGHDVTIAARHYIQTTEADYERATVALPQSIPVSDGNPRPTADSISARHGNLQIPIALQSHSAPHRGIEPRPTASKAVMRPAHSQGG